MSARMSVLRPFLALCVAGALLALFAAPALAAVPNQLPDPIYKVRGKVYALAETPVGSPDAHSIYIGGKFSRASDAIGKHAYFPVSLTRFGLDGVGDPTFLPIISMDQAGLTAGTVQALALSADGDTLYVGGDFAYVNGEEHKDIAAVSTATGAVISAFAPKPSNNVDTILVGSTDIYIGGSFKTVTSGGTTRPALYVAALNAATGALDLTWTGSADSTVRDLEWDPTSPPNTRIWVSGHFANLDGSPRQSVGRLNLLDGTLDAWTAQSGVIPSPMTCWHMAPALTVLYVGCGAGPNFAAAFNETSGTSVWKRSTPGNVEGIALAPEGQDIVISGHFGTNHKTRSICNNPTMDLHGLNELAAADGSFECWAPHLYPDTHNAKGAWTVLTSSDGHIWTGGWFDQICFPDNSVPTNCTDQQGVARFSSAP